MLKFFALGAGLGIPSESQSSSSKVTSLRVQLVILLRQIEIILKDSTALFYVTKSVQSSHLCKMT